MLEQGEIQYKKGLHIDIHNTVHIEMRKTNTCLFGQKKYQKSTVTLLFSSSFENKGYDIKLMCDLHTNVVNQNYNNISL